MFLQIVGRSFFDAKIAVYISRTILNKCGIKGIYWLLFIPKNVI